MNLLKALGIKSKEGKATEKMNLLKVLEIKSKEERETEKLRALGWERPSIKWKLPSLLHFSLVALDEEGEKPKDWYLGTRGFNESDTTIFLVAYGLTDVPERTVSSDEAIQIWSKWLQRPAFPFPWMPLEHWGGCFKWARQDVPIESVAEEQMGELPECTFLVSAVRGIA